MVCKLMAYLTVHKSIENMKTGIKRAYLDNHVE